MKKIRTLVLLLAVLVMLIALSAAAKSTTVFQEKDTVFVIENKQNQTVNLFVSHGHCSTPFGAVVDNLRLSAPVRNDLGNPLEGMRISFEIDPNSFNVCAGDDLTARIKTTGLFIGENEEKITFRSTDVYTMGIDWYQVNGKLSIKGVEKGVKLFVTGIRDPKDTMASALVLEGQMNLFDWGIDYDKIVSGKSETVPTQWMHINMKIEIAP